MIEERAIVLEVDGQHVWVETGARGGCSSCAGQSGCGAGLLGRALGPRPRSLRLLNTVGAARGDEVVVGIREADLLGAASLLYGLPIGLLIAGAGLGQWWFGTDLAAIALGLGGLFLGLWLVRFAARYGGSEQRQPRILRRSGSSTLSIRPVAADRRWV